MQRELLACDAEEPLEIGGGGNPEIPAWWLLLFLIYKKKKNYISLRLLGMFIDDDVLCATELSMQERGKNHQPQCQGLEASVPQTRLKISGYRLSSRGITLY